jgi:hypothetical protein
LTIAEDELSARSAKVFVDGDVTTLWLLHLHNVAVVNAAIWTFCQYEPVSGLGIWDVHVCMRVATANLLLYDWKNIRSA